MNQHRKSQQCTFRTTVELQAFRLMAQRRQRTILPCGATASAIMLSVLFGFAFSWISAFIGMSVKDVETAQVAGFVWVFPIVFASSMFVPVQSMPGWLQAFAKINPVTVTTDAMRALSLGEEIGGPIWPPLWKSLAWIGGILAVFLTLAVNRYRRIS